MTVSEQIIQVIDKLCEKFGIAINWTSKNVIPYVETLCKKLVTYEIATSIVWMIIMILVSIGSIVATKKFAPRFKKGLKEQGTFECGWTIGTVFAIISLITINFATVCVLGQQIMDIVKCATFPEMYIFEYVSNLISTSSAA